MWSIKFLSGPKAGKEILLQPGLVVLGRDETCQISIPSHKLSKKHAQILVKEKQLVLEDLDSRNGTFVKGKQIKRKALVAGDRVVLSDMVFEVKKKTAGQNFPVYGMPYPPPPQSHTSLNLGAEFNSQKNTIDTKASLIENIQRFVKSYTNEVVLPGIYKLAEWVEFKTVVASFMIGFVVVTMALSSFPLVSILKSSVEQESRNNAENIAITLAMSNRNHLKKGLQDAVTVDFALRRPGVEKAYIISAIDGRILAPAEVAHTYPKNPLIHKARRLNQRTVEKTGSSIAAIVPINFYNPETGENSPRAYSVVIYDMSSLAVGTKKVASLLAQTFLIASIIGLVLFFLLINLIEFPIRSLNSQLERSLKDEKAPSVSIHYQSKILTELCSHINSALNQISLNQMLNAKNEDEESGKEINRQNEMDNLVEIIGFPALSINIEEETVASVNSSWTDQVGFSEILNQSLSEISDSQLKESLLTLIEQGKNNPQEIAFGEIQLNQMKLQSTCQVIMGKNSPAYAIVTFMPPSAEEGAA